MKRFLEGVTVLDLSTTISGPFCTFYLCDMGAEVIKVEEPGKGDMSRYLPPFTNGLSETYVVLNRGKKSVTIDLKNEKGLALVKELVASSDVLIENFTPGKVEKLGLDYESVRRINPRIVMCSISGYGQTGPLSRLPGYDGVIQAQGGIMSVTGDPEKPMRVGMVICDFTSAMMAMVGIIAALYRRGLTGEGDYIDISMFDVAVNLLSTDFLSYANHGVVVPRTGNRFSYATPFDTFPTRDSFILIVAANDNTFRNLCNAIGRPELAEDPRFADMISRNNNHAELRPIIEEWTLQHTTEEALSILLPAGAPASPINTAREVVEHPHTAARDMVLELEQPGAGPIKIFGSCIKARNSEIGPRSYAPALGEHNEMVLREFLGKSDEEIESLKAAGALG